MSGASTMKCPECGAWLEYSPEKKKLVCPFCSSEFDESAVEERQKPSTSSLRGYHCQSCGAEIVTGETTAATRCYFCHSPVILSDRLDEEYTPDSVIPFAMTPDAAKAAFKTFISKHKYVDKRFFSEQQMEDFSGVYYPYWYGDLNAEAEFEGEGVRSSTTVGPRENIITKRYFSVRRAAKLTFPKMVRKALKMTDRKLSDGIFPYDLSAAVPFNPGYLSGFLAEKRDIDQQEVLKDMEAEASRAASTVMHAEQSFDSLNGKTTFHMTGSKMSYLLLPVWVLTYRGEKADEPYVFMMNGQRGTVCGRLPIDKKKLWLTALIAGAIVCAILCLGGKMIW